MSLNLYYGVKDPECSYSFKGAEWLTPYQVLDRLKIRNFLSYQINPNELVYPNELIVSDLTQTITDVILLAKYTDKYGSLKLKSIFLSQLILNLAQNKYLILSIEKDTYYWSTVNNAHFIPRHAFRVGFDNVAKQFSYIGRMKVSSLLPNQRHNTTNKVTNLFGSLINIYEYIPAIVLQLHDLDNQYDSFWSRVRLSIKNSNSNTAHLDFNLVSSNYEVLCLKKQPATLKQLCIIKLVKLEEETFLTSSQQDDPKREEINRSLRSLPSSIRNLLWPSYLMPGQCIIKNGKMRSVNGVYEISINHLGSLRFLFVNFCSNTQVITYEKNVESLLVSKTGIYLIYDNNQATRRPTLLYKHQQRTSTDSHCTFVLEDSHFENLFDNSLCANFIVELSDDGILRVILQKNKPNVINLINLNEFFRPIKSLQAKETLPDLTVTTEGNSNKETQNQSLLINVRFIANMRDLTEFPIKIIDFVVNILKSIFQKILFRVPNSHLN